MKLRRKELLIFGIILVLALLSWLLLSRKKASADCGSIRITVEGVEYGTYSLGENQKIKINGTNTARIRDGECRMIEATCPDHLCIHQPVIDARGGMIICLPNQVIIEGIPAEDSGNDDSVDAVAR